MLVFVLTALAVLALVAGRFASRIDALREQTSTLSAYAHARLGAGNAAAAGLYWISTQPIGPAGFGAPMLPSLWADGRPYRLDIGAEIRVQDMRGLYPLNAIQRETFAALLRLAGADAVATDSYMDVILDYQDTDNLKRLNGAERDAYATLGLPPPRNDWLLSVRELSRMPLWHDHPELVKAIEPLVSTNREAGFNPNTAPRQMLQALLPQALPEQIKQFEALRAAKPFMSGGEVRKLTGVQFLGDEISLHTSDHYRLTVWSPGMPRALQYNVMLLPVGPSAPWLISEVHSVTRSASSKAQEPSAIFPLALSPVAP